MLTLKRVFFRGTRINVFKLQAQVVQKVANAMHWINLYPADSAIGVPNTLCPLANDVSSG